MAQIKTKKILTVLSLFLFSIMAPRPATYCASANSLANKGNSNYKKKDYPKAYEYYKKAEEISPDDARIKYNTGNAFYRLNDYESAAASFEEAAKDKKIKAKSFYNAGNAYFKNQKYENAAKSYKKAILLNPEDENFKHNLQLALKKIRQQKKTCDNKDKKNKDGKKDKKKNEQSKENEKNKQKSDKPEMSKENAERLLKMIKEKEKSSVKPETMNLRMLKKSDKEDKPQGKDW